MENFKVIKSDKTEYDWEKELGVRAVNRDSRVFETISDARDLTIVLYDDKADDFDEWEVSDALAENLRNGFDNEYTLYNSNLLLVGFAYYEV